MYDIFQNLIRGRAHAFAAYTVLRTRIASPERPEIAAELSTVLISLECTIENITLSIGELENLTPDEQAQETLERDFLKQAGLLRDERFKDA